MKTNIILTPGKLYKLIYNEFFYEPFTGKIALPIPKIAIKKDSILLFVYNKKISDYNNFHFVYKSNLCRLITYKDDNMQSFLIEI